ncbi:MAG: hypothetical protein V1723_01230 [Candidatus Uhrbacteria bacterium]
MPNEFAPFVIGLVGEQGSGKGTSVELFRTLAAPLRVVTIRFSGILRETLTLWDIPITRANLQGLTAIMIKQYGADALAHAIEQRVRRTDVDIVVLDGVRWEADAELLRRFPTHLLVYVTADANTRYERLCARGENAGERNMTREQFAETERAINEASIPQIGATADVRIMNTETVPALEQQVRDIVATVRTRIDTGINN